MFAVGFPGGLMVKVHTTQPAIVRLLAEGPLLHVIPLFLLLSLLLLSNKGKMPPKNALKNMVYNNAKENNSVLDQSLTLSMD